MRTAPSRVGLHHTRLRVNFHPRIANQGGPHPPENCRRQISAPAREQACGRTELTLHRDHRLHGFFTRTGDEPRPQPCPSRTPRRALADGSLPHTGLIRRGTRGRVEVAIADRHYGDVVAGTGVVALDKGTLRPAPAAAAAAGAKSTINNLRCTDRHQGTRRNRAFGNADGEMNPPDGCNSAATLYFAKPHNRAQTGVSRCRATRGLDGSTLRASRENPPHQPGMRRCTRVSRYRSAVQSRTAERFVTSNRGAAGRRGADAEEAVQQTRN